MEPFINNVSFPQIERPNLKRRHCHLLGPRGGRPNEIPLFEGRRGAGRFLHFPRDHDGLEGRARREEILLGLWL